VALIVAMLSGVGVAGLVAGFAAPASAQSGTALINGDTVSGNPSVEQTIATNMGLSVTVVSGSTWDSMTAADFAQYTVLIIGDPTCGPLASSVTSDNSTWTSAVMATAGGNTVVGNRVVWGSAPVLAGAAHPGAAKGITDGIAYAAALAPTTGHATGVYFDASCDAQALSPNPALVATLNMLSVGTARPWTENAHPTCGTTVSVIGTTPAFSNLKTSDLTGWPCAVHESFPTFETDFVPIAISTDSSDASTCGTDTTTQATECGEAFFLAAGPEVMAMDSEISVSPLTGTGPVDTTHTITATVRSVAAGTPLVGQLVSFSVSGVNAGATGTCVPADCKSNSAGQVTFTYTGTNAGLDTITASFMCNPAIHTATSDMTWLAPAVTTTPVTTTPVTTTPVTTPTGVPPKVFQVELRGCTNLHVGYNQFPAGVVVDWRVTQRGTRASSGHFTTAGGGKKNHFVSPSLGLTLAHNPKGTVRLTWVINGTSFSDTAARATGC